MGKKLGFPYSSMCKHVTMDTWWVSSAIKNQRIRDQTHKW